jgi:hypothetical protein
MHDKANALIEQMNVVNAEVIRVAEACSGEQWQMGVVEETAVSLQALNDAQLKSVGAIAIAGGQEFSGEWIVQMFAIGHAENHLKVIKTTIGMED